MKKVIWFLALISGGLAAGCDAVHDVQAEQSAAPAAPVADSEEDVALDQLPDLVKSAATAAVAGFVLESAEKETEEGALHYCLEGTANGERVEIEVDTNGKVLEIEHEDDDDDGDDDDDDDDEDEDDDD